MNYELNYLVEHGIIDISSIQSMYEMNKRKELLDKHPYDYWQGKNGKWYVYLPDKEKGRVLKKRNTQKEIEDVVVGYQSELIENPTIKEVFDEWNDYRLDLKKIEKSSHTRMKQVFYLLLAIERNSYLLPKRQNFCKCATLNNPRYRYFFVVGNF